ncbi:MAG: hypothetical protein ACYC9N_20060, partial [Thermoanaerobaculia bacterium]
FRCRNLWQSQYRCAWPFVPLLIFRWAVEKAVEVAIPVCVAVRAALVGSGIYAASQEVAIPVCVAVRAAKDIVALLDHGFIIVAIPVCVAVRAAAADART